MNNKRQYNKIPTVLQEKEFNEFVKFLEKFYQDSLKNLKNILEK